MAERLDQKRAQHAWSRAMGSAGNTDFRNLAKSAPALIMNNGLMQTLAFLQGKSGDHHAALLNGLLDWLSIELGIDPKFEAAMQTMFNSSSSEYRRQTTEALAWLKWLRQFVDATKSEAK